MGREHYHALGEGLRALGAVGVVVVGLAAGPAGDGVLQLVEHLDVDVVGRAVEGHELAEAVVVVVLVGELEDGLAGLLAQPHDGAADELVGPVARRHLPGVGDAREVAGGLQVEGYAGVVVELEERGGHVVGDGAFHGGAHHGGAVLAPGHGHDARRAEDVAHAEGDGRGGRLVALVFLVNLVAHVGREQHQACHARAQRAGLVEAERTLGAELAEREVEAAAVGNLLLVLHAVLEHALARDGGVDGVYVLGAHVHAVEEHLAQACQRAGAFGAQGEELGEVEHDDAVKAHLTLLVHFYKVGVDGVGAAARAEGYDAAVLGGYVFLYELDDMVGQIGAAVVHVLENAGVDFLFAAKSCQLELALGRIVALGDAFERDLGA